MKRKIKAATPLAELFERRGFPGRTFRPNVAKLFRPAFREFSGYLGRQATVGDLSDDVLLAWREATTRDPRGRSITTVENHVARVVQFWAWLAKNNHVVAFPEKITTQGRPRKTRVRIPELPTSRRPVRSFPPDMALWELIESHYVPHAAARKRKAQLTPNAIGQLRTFHGYLALYLRREPRVADLQTPVDAFLAWLKIGFPSKKMTVHRDYMKALGRFAGFLTYELRGRDSRVLSEEPDTLWGICLNRYFPTKPNLKAEDTRRQYKIAIADFRDYLGREPKAEDLTADNVLGLMKVLDAWGLSPSTTNERRGRLVSLWNWLARKRETAEFPTIEKLKVPRRIPRAWSRDELERLFESCRKEEGEIAPGVLAADFWVGLHAVLWDSGERIGAVMAATWEMLDVERGLLELPAEVRKGRSADMLHRLHPNTVALLLRMKPAGYERIFHYPFNEVTFYRRYDLILERGGLPTDRKSKFHRMRKSVASHLQATGVDACAALGHSSPEVTRGSYIDPRIVIGQSAPSAVLFRPENEPARIGYAPREFEPAEEAWL